MHHRHPDRELAPDLPARAFALFQGQVGLDRNHGGARVGELLGVDRLADRPPAKVLQDACVHREGVVPTLALQDLEVDGVVAELALQPAVQDLDEVSLGDTGAELVHQRVDRRPRGARRAGSRRRHGMRQRPLDHGAGTVRTCVSARRSRHWHGYTAPEFRCRSPRLSQSHLRPKSCGVPPCSSWTTNAPGGSSSKPTSRCSATKCRWRRMRTRPSSARRRTSRRWRSST